MKKKTVALLLALVLTFGVAVGGTIAWLTDTTDEVKNTFTTSDVDIDLTETEREYQMIPGYTIDKDPKVTVEAGSEQCYVFVKVTEANWPEFMEDDGTTRKVNYEIAAGWEKLTGVDGVNDVWYRIQAEVPENTAVEDLPVYSVLKDDQVTVSGTLTKAEMNSITTKPTLTITAYACQYMKNNTDPFTAAEAWANITAE